MARQSETQITFRLPKALAARIDKLAAESSRGRSEVLRAAIEAYVDVAVPGLHLQPSDRVKSLIGSLRTGTPDLAERHSDYVKSILRRGRGS